MDLYHIALFLHILTLLVAAVATALTKLAVDRRDQAGTVGEALEWHKTMMSASKWFPICIASFVITGFYMLSVTHVSAFDTGFIVAGIVGVTLLLASGTFLSAKAKALESKLQIMVSDGADTVMPRLSPPAAVTVLPVLNTFIALSVMFDMVTKPTSMVVALSVLGVGIVLGVGLAMKRPEGAVEDAPAA